MLGALLALLGLAPLLVSAAWYLIEGHIAQFWQALVLSNFSRSYGSDKWARIYIFFREISVPLTLGVGGLMLRRLRGEFSRDEALIAGWLAVAIIAVLVFPTYYVFYALPVLAPLCVASAPTLHRARAAALPVLLFGLLMVWHSGEIDFHARALSRAESSRLVAYVKSETPDHRLLVWGYPSYLYVMTGSAPASILAFPPHLFDLLEQGASGLDEVAETRRILAQRPEAVVIQTGLLDGQRVVATDRLVDAYVRKCKRMKQFSTRDHFGPQTQIVYSGCAAADRSAPPRSS
jgi:hypothetical protein